MRKLSFLILYTICLNVYSQDGNPNQDFDNIISLMRHIKVFQSTYPQEKVYLHFDNTGYFKGERMYFKAYVFRTDNGKMTDISSVLYVDFLNPSGDVLHKSKLKLENGQAHGDILVDSVYETGFFEIRAYTRYMLNFGPDVVFSRVFPVFKKPELEGDFENPTIDHLAYHQRLPEREVVQDSINSLDPINLTKRKNISRTRGYHINVYPEGGKLVKNVESRVAFTVTDQDNHPVALLGEILDKDNNTLTIVESNNQGKGIFYLIPTDTDLRMILTTPDKKRIEFDMPDVLEEGAVMSVDPIQDDVVTASILSSKGMEGKFMAYSLMNEGNIYTTDTLHLSQYYGLRFKRERLRPGVNQLTLFDSKGHIHSERLFFVCPKTDSKDSIIVQNNNDLLKPCGKVALTLHSEPNSRLSFSAMDASTMANGKYGNINTYMLLGSDIRGYIPHPEYYFESDDTQHRMAADSLMLFNGWRRYDWQVMADVTPWKQPLQEVEDQLYVYGKIKPALSHWKVKHPVENVDMTLYLFNDQGLSLYGETVTDSTGFYAFKIPDINGLWNMQILTKIKDKLKTFEVLVDRQFSPQTRYVTLDEASMIDYPSRYMNFEIDTVAFDLMNTRRAEMRRLGNNEYVITPAEVKAKKQNWRYTKSSWHDEYNGKLHANLYYDCKAITENIKDVGESQPCIYDWLIEHNTSMDGVVDIDLIGNHVSGTATYNKRDIIWIVDNHLVGYTGHYLKSLTPDYFYPETSNIDMLLLPVFMDDVKSVYIWSDQPSKEYYVVIYIYTYPYYSTASKKGRRRTYFQGYDVPTKFEMEDYNLVPPVPDDFRRTLYWNPNVVTDENGNAVVEFFNNSTCKEMYISAEGITPDCKFITTK